MKTYKRYILISIALAVSALIIFNIPKINNSETTCETGLIAGLPSYKFDYKEKEIIEQVDTVITEETETVAYVEPVVYKPTVTYNAIDTTNSTVLETYTGTMSAYAPDCYGCSGRTASGLDVTNGNIYYKDSTYGTIRIVAGDSSYKLGTIVRITNSSLSSVPIIAIILDRGGSIGFGKQYQYDLLVESESNAYEVGVKYNTKFEILRLGY